jgi:hypothetical protein
VNLHRPGAAAVGILARADARGGGAAVVTFDLPDRCQVGPAIRAELEVGRRSPVGGEILTGNVRDVGAGVLGRAVDNRRGSQPHDHACSAEVDDGDQHGKGDAAPRRARRHQKNSLVKPALGVAAE